LQQSQIGMIERPFAEDGEIPRAPQPFTGGDHPITGLLNVNGKTLQLREIHKDTCSLPVWFTLVEKQTPTISKAAIELTPIFLA
jgi:hypothetical protein